MKGGRDQMAIDPDPDEIYTKRKKRIVNVDEQYSFVITQREIPKRWLAKFFGKNVFIHPCRNESAHYKFREKSREHPTSFYSNKFKKGENFFDRSIFKRYRGKADQVGYCNHVLAYLISTTRFMPPLQLRSTGKVNLVLRVFHPRKERPWFRLVTCLPKCGR